MWLDPLGSGSFRDFPLGEFIWPDEWGRPTRWGSSRFWRTGVRAPVDGRYAEIADVEGVVATQVAPRRRHVRLLPFSGRIQGRSPRGRRRRWEGVGTKW